MTKEITKREQALELHNKILVSAQLAQNNLWEMCSGLKQMRDGKLYKELGYQNFEEYCNEEFNMSRRNAYHYISVVENISPENVKTFSHFGRSKLMLLSTLSEPEQEKITEENDVESMTVRELERQINQLKRDCAGLRNTNANISEQLNIAREDYRSVHQEKLELRKQIAQLKDDIDVLESRPIEVAVAEPSEDVRRLKETIKSLERSTEEQMERMENEHIEDVRGLHKKYSEQIKKLEKELSEQSNNKSDEEQAAFDIYLSYAHDALFNLVGCASRINKPGCNSRIKALFDEFRDLISEGGKS